jgi:hypothetical protein
LSAIWDRTSRTCRHAFCFGGIGLASREMTCAQSAMSFGGGEACDQQRRAIAAPYLDAGSEIPITIFCSDWARYGPFVSSASGINKPLRHIYAAVGDGERAVIFELPFLS